MANQFLFFSSIFSSSAFIRFTFTHLFFHDAVSWFWKQPYIMSCHIVNPHLTVIKQSGYNQKLYMKTNNVYNAFCSAVHQNPMSFIKLHKKKTIKENPYVTHYLIDWIYHRFTVLLPYLTLSNRLNPHQINTKTWMDSNEKVLIILSEEQESERIIGDLPMF